MRGGFEWFVAWRYLRERGRRASPATLAVGLFLLAAAATLFYLADRTAPLSLSARLSGEFDWRTTFHMSALATLVLGQLATVFGYLHLVQTVFTTISTFGVFVGTWALVIALSVMNGFEVDLREKILGSNAHLLVTREEGSFTEWRDVSERLARVPGIVAHTPYVTSEVVVVASSNYGGAIIKGIDPKTVGKVTDLERNLEDPTAMGRLGSLLPDAGVVAPADATLAAPLGADPDDETPPPDLSGESDGAVVAGAPDVLDDETPPPDLSGDAAPHEFPIPDRLRRVTDPRLLGLDGILVGRELAANLHLHPGKEVQIVSPLEQITPAGAVPRTRSFRVAGIFYSGMYEYDTKSVYVALPALQRFLSLGDEVNGLEIRVDDVDEPESVAAAVRARLGAGYRVQDWKELNRNLFSALKLEKIAMFLVLAIIILVASFSIVSNLIMIVVEKAREVAILKSMGATNRGIMRIFMIEGLYIGLVGTLFGIAFGVVTCLVLEQFGFPLDPKVYYIDQMPVAMEPLALVAVGGAGVAISFLATIYPALVAARMRPVDGLRYE